MSCCGYGKVLRQHQFFALQTENTIPKVYESEINIFVDHLLLGLCWQYEKTMARHNDTLLVMRVLSNHAGAIDKEPHH